MSANDYKDLIKILTDSGCQIEEPVHCSNMKDILDLGFYESPFFKLVESYYCGYTEEITVYRFRKAEFAISELRNQKLRSYNLLSQLDNDFAEASEFYLRARTLKLVCSENDEESPDSIENVRDNAHILCFSKEPSERLWEEYTGHKGCCLVFQAKWRVVDFSRFAAVLYGADELFDKMNKIQSQIKRRFNKTLFLPGIYHFALLYKRARFSWENEIRFLMQPRKFNIGVIEETQQNSWGLPEVRKYIEIPFNDDSLFPIKLTLKDVIVGKQINPDHRKQIDELKNKLL